MNAFMFCLPLLSGASDFSQIEAEGLRQEIEALASSKAGRDQAHEASLDRIEGERTRLMDALTALRTRNDARSEALSAAPIASAARGRAELLDRIAALERGNPTLQDHSAASAAKPVLSDALIAAIVSLEERAGPKRSIESFFAADGTLVEGEVLRLGDLAAYRTDSWDILVPTGGRLRTLKSAAAKPGHGAVALDGYLLAPGDESAPMRAGDWASRFLAGGPVMWPIAVLAILSLLVMFERTWTLSRLARGCDALPEQVARMVSEARFDDARAAVAARDSATEVVLDEVLKCAGLERDEQENRASASVLSVRPRLERYLSALHVVAGVAPLLGLLGTVTGMIATFWVLTESGNADPRALSGGISEALLTTQFGLVVAVPTVVLAALMSRWSSRVLAGLQIGALKVLNAMEDARGRASLG